MQLIALVIYQPVNHCGRRAYERKCKLPLKPLFYYFHMQKTKESAPEPEPKGRRSLWFKAEGGIIETQLLEGIFQVFILMRFHWIKATKYHRLDFFISR